MATSSAHKLAELRALLALEVTEVVSLADLDISEEAPEDEPTFEANALAKARFYAGRSDLSTLADDSGLEVDALGGGPGVHTRRYAGPKATDEQNNIKLLRALKKIPAEGRGARYRCVLAFLDPTTAPGGDLSRAIVRLRLGVLEGRIAEEPRGTGGFGYDPLFEPAAELADGRTMAELTAEEKNEISHRAQAARAMGEWLRTRGY